MDSDQTPTHKAFFVQTFTSRQVFQITHHLNCQNLQTVAECSDVQKRKTGKTLNWCQIFVFKKMTFSIGFGQAIKYQTFWQVPTLNMKELDLFLL